MIVWAIADRVLPFVGLCVLLIGSNLVTWKVARWRFRRPDPRP